jgi:hypothetical protein
MAESAPLVNNKYLSPSFKITLILYLALVNSKIWINLLNKLIIYNKN